MCRRTLDRDNPPEGESPVKVGVSSEVRVVVEDMRVYTVRRSTNMCYKGDETDYSRVSRKFRDVFTMKEPL